MDKELVELKKNSVEAEKEMRRLAGTIGNIVADDCPVSQTEVRAAPSLVPFSLLRARLMCPIYYLPSSQDDNVLVRTYHPDGPDAQPQARTDIIAHHEVMHRLGFFDLERGTSSSVVMS